MTQEQIIEGNKLIAEFMGAVVNNYTLGEYEMYGIVSCLEDGENEQHFFIPNEMLFHYSWDWLMPVVDKIESIIFNKDNSFNVTIGSTNFCVIQDSNGEVYESIEDYRESKLLTTYVAITEFIKWYNEQLKENECSTN